MRITQIITWSSSPWWHLVFQGEVADPKRPGTAFDYPDLDALILRRRVDGALRSPDSAHLPRLQCAIYKPPHYFIFEVDGEGRDIVTTSSATWLASRVASLRTLGVSS